MLTQSDDTDDNIPPMTKLLSQQLRLLRRACRQGHIDLRQEVVVWHVSTILINALDGELSADDEEYVAHECLTEALIYLSQEAQPADGENPNFRPLLAAIPVAVNNLQLSDANCAPEVAHLLDGAFRIMSASSDDEDRFTHLTSAIYSLAKGALERGAQANPAQLTFLTGLAASFEDLHLPRTA